MATSAEMGRATRTVLRLLAMLTLGFAVIMAAAPASAASGSWPKYLHDQGGTGFSPDGGITAATAANLKTLPGWPVKLGATISTQPVLANGLIYSGAWDGNEYALSPSGAIQWKRFLGITTKGKACQYPIGIAGTPVIANATVAGSSRSVLYVGGGGNADAAGRTVSDGTAQLFALDALSGDVLWHTSLGSSPDHFIWSSPAFYAPPSTSRGGSGKGSVYVGVSAFADCPLIQGQLVQLDASTGTVQHTFNVVPNGCIGGSVWGSPTIDDTEGAVYFATGNPDYCSRFSAQIGSVWRPKRAAATAGLAVLGLLVAGFAWSRPSIRGIFWAGVGLAVLGLAGTSLLVVGPRIAQPEPYSPAIVKLSAADLHVEGHWQVPPAEATFDDDFGSTPTLFHGSVTPDGASRALVGLANKNGIYYVFDRTNLDQGPVARLRIATGGNPPTSGNGSISPSAFDGSRLYIAGGHIAVNGQLVPGTLSAYDPNDLRSPLWRTGIDSGPVLGAVSVAPEVAVVGAGSTMVVLDTIHGHLLFQAPAANAGAATPAIFYGAATIVDGVVYQGDTHGNLYAYAAH